MQEKRPVKLSDYKPYPFLIPDINIDFNILEDKVIVNTSMIVVPNSQESTKLILQGNKIDLNCISLNGRNLELNEYEVSEYQLIVYDTPISKFELKIRSTIDPYNNRSLQGLYFSSGMLTTQCEAEGFRSICFHPDRPDVLSKYLVRIEADCHFYPILLSNGNKKYHGKVKDSNNRHEIIWDDPFPKPSYLFALVAGNLSVVNDKYITNSGKIVDIYVYVEKGDEQYTKHAIESLKNAMKWDEEKYQLEYDLNEYKIVAVRHFNMGAMENKGLNIFNSKLVLADSKTATDYELERIESVIAHEYFHNWTGNRITCRDWFQLSLKEGLTVFRDQSFTADLHHPGLKRVEDVSFLRNYQFTEDRGPTSHAVKPKEYVAIDNFYTTTIYEKGAELIRMLELLLGQEKFMRGMKFYLDTFDGRAATTDDFVDSIMQGAFSDKKKASFNFEQFKNWYYKEGTPKVYVNQSWNEKTSTLEILFEQKLNGYMNDENVEMVIPILYSCYSTEKDFKPIAAESLFILDKQKKKLEIKSLNGDSKPPVLSIFRRFSSPVTWESDLSTEDYLFLLLNDNDYFVRWDSAQFLMKKIIKYRINNQVNSFLEDKFIHSLFECIKVLAIEDPFFLSTLMTMPGISEIENSLEEVDPISVYKQSMNFQLLVGCKLLNDLRILSDKLLDNISQVWPKGKGERKLLGTLWSYLSISGDSQTKKVCVESINSSSMTMARAALSALKPLNCSETNEASNLFYSLWIDNPIVLDTWFEYEASRPHYNAIDIVEKLLSHPKFDWMAPNATRAVLGGFSRNIESFHSSDGTGYFFMAEKLIELDKINPITASRMVKVFSKWKTLIEQNKKNMYEAIQKINSSKISSNTREVVELLLG